MDSAIVKSKLIEVLHTIQALSGESCPVIDDGTKPITALPKFTSKVWPVASGLLGLALGKPFPCDRNIFADEATKEPRSITETVAFVIKLIEEEEEKKVEAEVTA